MANKKGPLSKAEVFYITEHVKSGKDVNEIALDLDRAVKSIQKCVTKVIKENPAKIPTAGDQFARRPGVTVMTENASMMADAKKKKSLPSGVASCITKLKTDQS
jgi:hypothetical protein